MVTIRLAKMKVQEVILWGVTYKNMQEETGLKWDDDQEEILETFRQSLKKEVKE